MARAFRCVALGGWLGVAAAGMGCARHGFVRPQGPTVPVADAATLWRDVTSRCGALLGYQAQVRLSGRVGGQRVPGMTVGVIATRDGRIGLDARLSGSVVFVLGGDANQARLVLPQDRRVVEAPAAAILDALVGVAWDPPRLMAVLSGCVTADPRVIDAVEFPNGTFAVHLSGNDVAYVGRMNGRQVVRAGGSGGFGVEYRRSAAAWPMEIVIQSDTGRTPSVSLTLRVEAAVANPTPDPGAFNVTVPQGTEPMSIAELRTEGPLGNRRRP